jgi:hypothetical protein
VEPDSDSPISSLRRIAEKAMVWDGRGQQVPLASLVTRDHDALTLAYGGWKIMARLDGDIYIQTDHLTSGDRGAMAFPITCFPPSNPPRGQVLGWIGSGTNRFRVESVVLVGQALFHLGTVEAGGFHVSKPNLHMWHDSYTPEMKAADAASRGRAILARRRRGDVKRLN